MDRLEVDSVFCAGIGLGTGLKDKGESWEDILTPGLLDQTVDLLLHNDRGN